MKRLTCVLALIALARLASFGETVWSSNESIKSENGKYVARVAATPNGIKQLQVSIVATQHVLWERNIDWEEDYRCLLSDDGLYFSMVNDDYSEKQYLVLVYSQYDQAGYSIKEIKLGYEDLMVRDGKKIWIDLNEDTAWYVDDKPSGKAKFLDLKILSGKILEIRL
jgi:hypothetical protein